MPAVRLSRRRRSSIAICPYFFVSFPSVLTSSSSTAFSPAKPGIYGISSPSPRPFTFAPNVTPGTFVEPDSLSPASSNDHPASPSSTLFPPSDLPAPAPSRRRVPPGKRRSLGYIPRPPNAFMLFRADFVRQKHVPGSIETNHGSLSKIIGLYFIISAPSLSHSLFSLVPCTTRQLLEVPPTRGETRMGSQG
jgi:hypothetical protein